MQTRVALSLLAAGVLSATASAEIVQIDIVGEVDFGGIPFGPWQGASSGDPVSMSFQVDSNTFTDSMLYPTRGYDIIPSSFALTLNGHTAGLADPQPFGDPAYFILRNDDPVVDGFFLGWNVDGFPTGVATDEPGGIADTFDALFSATYEGSRLSSLDILDAVGIYDFAGLSVFNWGLEDGPVQPMGFIFESWSISVVPAPSTLAGLAPLGLMFTRRRRG